MQIAKTCSHRKLDGSTCRSLALKDRRYCHYHERYFDRDAVPKTGATSYALTPFEDTRSILFTIHQLISSFLNGTIEESKFTKCIYALQVAAQYASRPDALSPDAAAALAEQKKEEQLRKEQKATRNKTAKQEPGDDDVPPLARILGDSLSSLRAGTLLHGVGDEPDAIHESPAQKAQFLAEFMQRLQDQKPGDLPVLEAMQRDRLAVRNSTPDPTKNNGSRK